MNLLSALVIPADPEQPVRDIGLNVDNSLKQLQELVGGSIEAVIVPEFADEPDGADVYATAYVNANGLGALPTNWRATDFMVPGAGMAWGSVVHGDFVLVGFVPSSGTHADLPARARNRARLIADEAG